MNAVLRKHWGVIVLSCAAFAFIALQILLSTHRPRSVTEIYFADRLTDAHHTLIDEYNRLHEGKVRVVPIDFPNEDFTTNERKEILARSLRNGGEGIDLFAVDVIWVQRFERWAEELNGYVTDGELKEFTEEGLSSCYKEGKLVALPFARVRGVLLLREDLLRGMPGGNAIIERVSGGISWEQFVEYGKSLSNAGPYYLFPAADYEGLLCVYTEILLGQERDYFLKHGFDFNTPAARSALRFLVDLVHTHRVTPVSAATMTEVSSYEHFVRENGLFLRGWTSYERDFQITPDYRRLIRMAPLPHFNDGGPVSIVGGWNLMVSKFSDKKEAAIAFARFLLERSSQEIMYAQGGFYPVRRAFYEDGSYATKYPELSRAHAMLGAAVHRPSHERYTRFSEILARHLSLAIRGRLGVEEALARASKAIESERMLPDQRGRGEATP
jgi:multiple sugar transport system substrate-binding protein